MTSDTGACIKLFWQGKPLRDIVTQTLDMNLLTDVNLLVFCISQVFIVTTSLLKITFLFQITYCKEKLYFLLFT